MAHRTSSRLLFTAFGVSLLAGAGQLGLAFGFGVVRLTGSFTGVSVNEWPAQLVWAGWFATNAAVVGAVLAERLVRPGGQLTGTTRQLAVAGSAALGALVVAPLCMRPARGAELVSVDPVWAVAICAGLGAVIGGGAALAVLVRPPLGWNMAVVAAVVWLLALLSVLPSLGASGPLTPVRLGVLEPEWLSADAAQQLALLILPTVALLFGAATAALARRRGQPPLVSVPTGAAGPVLVAFAYLAAGPGNASDRYQLTPYYGALVAVAVGALGSATAVLLPWPPRRPTTADTVVEPTAILQPLPEVPALPASTKGPTDPKSTATGQVVVIDRPAGAGPAAAGTGTSADQSTDTAEGSPPHWHWPDARSNASAGPATSAHPTASPVGVAASPESTEAGAALASAGDELADGDGGPDGDQPLVTGDSASVGDGSDIRSEVRAVEPTDEVLAAPPAKAPAPRRTRTPTDSPITEMPPAGADLGVHTEPASVPSTPVSAAPDTAAVESVEVTPAEAARRPGQRFPMPDLNRATAWNAFAPAGPRVPQPATAPAPHATTDPTVTTTDPIDTDTASTAGTATSPARSGSVVADTGTDPAATARNVSAAFAKPPAARAEDVQPDSEAERGRRGLFRRGKSRSGETGAAADRDESLPAQDEEYVDWVAGLSRPLDDDAPEPSEERRRSLRPSGRHHRD
ncbi:hypothetical protein [Micromonospora sp. LOL_024]|uniref:hypothetical protein n=1 Tax=Micromonospora sp. LOL_024 TaxID=3345412 RepID=UPI003A8A5A02